MIYLVRHGQTDWNLFRKFNGCTDTELNNTGVEQAKLQAENMSSVSFDACFCSPQKRARQTCEIIFKGAIVFDERLSEINCGEFEGTEETAESMKLFWQAVMNGDKGTENFKDFIKRNSNFCNMIAKEYKSKNILIVTHAANARVINYYFTGKPKEYDFSKAVAQNGEIIKFKD
ncbi:histidine phosphatase family protein [Anaerocolumna aminovalerica]|uniref:Probable phosphoglycerate mutase n=1 Tax=Anaerocolumna aminovalerica TaxID=1527 RepID=A0A1I5ERU7_9FIRM|nr:histidine phosphatase family protein [Anaerocolumna aminovalerica]MDU6266194.1 histidine phosphatase family protein [Anaerocolumna aminovalerica]SFO14083.1 probable phosphoglycerate mutase [Anaerocolumna aminovalerica]